jgi:DNA-binding transcriptional MerR regulator
MSMKDLWRKIIHLLHPSRLSTNIEIVGDTAYLLYCEDLYRILIDLHSKDDIWSMIVTLQDAGIQLKDWKFILPSKKERWQIQQRSQLHKKREELQERLSAMKQSYIYIFYLKFTKWDVAKELRELDDKIEELQDLIASYQTIHNE